MRLRGRCVGFGAHFRHYHLRTLDLSTPDDATGKSDDSKDEGISEAGDQPLTAAYIAKVFLTKA